MKLAALYPSHLDTVKHRYETALRATGFDAVVIFGGALHVAFLDDHTYPFKVNPHFKTWVPVVDNPNCFILYTPGKTPVLVFYQPVDYWYKPAETPSGYWVDSFDIKIITSPEQAKQHLPRGRIAYIGEQWDASLGGEANPQALLDRLHWERAWKTDYEIECMRRANDLGARGHRAAERAFRDGQSEYEIHLAYLRASSQTEEELPYSNIIAINENAAVLHYTQHIREPLPAEQRYSFLIDAGASVNGYASDITRSYAQRDDEYAELVAAMDKAQQSLCAAVRPGVPYPDIHFLAHRRAAEILVQFHFARGIDADGLLEKRITSTFLPHGVGHYLGLQVHDVGGHMADSGGKVNTPPKEHQFLRLTRPIEPANVFTIEPGFYFIEPLLAELKTSDNAKYIDWTRIDSFRKYGGVRIEDDLAVTESGSENLTRDAFARL